MRARDLAVAHASGNADSDATEAARLMSEHKLPEPLAPDRGPSLISVVDEKNADRPCHALHGRAVADGLPRDITPRPVAALELL
ncbi:hypothetical protein ACWCOW_32745 [Streptomyces sp. NPDC001939]